MSAPRILFSILAATLLAVGCTGRLPTTAEPSFNASTPTAPLEEQAFPSAQPSGSDTVQATGRGIGTIGSDG